MTSPDAQSDNPVFRHEIRPLMRAVLEACRKHDVPMFATFQEDERQFESYCLNADRSQWPKLVYLEWVNETWTLDGFFDRAIQEALKTGHDSVYLRAMGIPYESGGGADNGDRLLRAPRRKVEAE